MVENTTCSGKGSTVITTQLSSSLPDASFPSIFKLVIWCVLTYFSKEFSIFLPVFQSKAGASTFLLAEYKYDDENTNFDNSILTYGTDYALCVIMLYAVYKCLNATSFADANTATPHNEPVDPSKSKSLRRKSACLFMSYAISVAVGGYAHHNFTGGVDDLNTLHFRICWTICVGSVSAAGGFMGACGSEIYKRLNLQGDPEKVRFRLFHVHDIMWAVYGGYLTWVCARGGMSYKRPACDIFVAGTSQFVPTVYCILTVLSIKWNDAKQFLEKESFGKGDGDLIRRNFRYMFYLGLSLNAPLLPSYPLYVQYTSLSLGVVNAICHSNLTVAWGMQALSLYHFCQAFNYDTRIPNAKKES